MDVACIKIFMSRAIETTGTLIVIVFYLSNFLSLWQPLCQVWRRWTCGAPPTARSCARPAPSGRRRSAGVGSSFSPLTSSPSSSYSSSSTKYIRLKVRYKRGIKSGSADPHRSTGPKNGSHKRIRRPQKAFAGLGPRKWSAGLDLQTPMKDL